MVLSVNIGSSAMSLPESGPTMASRDQFGMQLLVHLSAVTAESISRFSSVGFTYFFMSPPLRSVAFARWGKSRIV